MTAPAAQAQDQDEITIGLYCPGGIKCSGVCYHGPNDAQRLSSEALFSGQYEEILDLGGFRSGKTTEGIRAGTELGVRYPANRVLICRKYTNDFNGSVAPIIEELMPDPIVLKRPTGKDPFYIIRSSGERPSEIWCLGLYGTDRKRIGKLKGLELGAVVVDQAEEITLDDFLFLKGRLSRPVPIRPILLLANPPNVGHWLHTWFELEKNKHKCEMFSMPTEANRHNIPEGYIENLRRDYADRPGWLKCYLEGTWGYVVLGDSAFVGFRADSHMRKVEYNPAKVLYRGWDFGWKHPAVTWHQFTEEGGLHQLHEDMGDKIDIRKYARHIVLQTNQRFPGASVVDYGDYAGNQKSDKDDAKSTIEILRQEEGIEVKSRPNPSIDARISLVQKYISMLSGAHPFFTVDPSCRITIDALEGGYGRDKENGEVIKDGFFEHIMDATGYVFWNLFQHDANEAKKRARQVKIRSASYGFGGVR